MVTIEAVAAKILAHLNDELSEEALVHWAEDAFVTVTESNNDIPNEAVILEVLTYLGAGDTPGFPLSWSVLSDFLAKLGVRVRVVAEAA
jgi:hypothetical protein